MAYVLNTPADQQAMLQQIGVTSLDDLLAQVPADLRLNRPLDLPPPLTEWELERHLKDPASRSAGVSTRVSFLGGGAAEHFIPAAVDEIAQRNEFYTAYTPYQAEASQGSLQAFFEFQSLVGDLAGLPVANASLYEGATAVGEAVLMAMRATGRHGRVVFVGGISPQTLDVAATSLKHLGCELVTVPATDGAADVAAVTQALTAETAAVVVQQPNFLGCLEDVAGICRAAKAAGALSIVSFHPLSVGILKRPGDLGTDLAVAEGQSLGIPLQYGGPYLGLLACREEFVRKLPGRLVGQTVDRQGRRCFVLNLQAREQHIRREKATSNICTNQGLMALRATVYLSLLGPQGLREVAERSCRLAHYAAGQLARVPGLSLPYGRPFWNEFVLQSTLGAETLIARARDAGIDIGPALSAFGPLPGMTAQEQSQRLLVAVTECRTRAEIDALVAALMNL